MISLSERIVALLEESKETVTFAESCTGGLVASSLVEAAGASRVFRESFVTYCDRAKRETLGVSEETLRRFTAVSEPAAREMALGLLAKTGADYGLSVTGYAGPEGGQAGLVYIGLASQEAVTVCEFHFSGSRNAVRRQAAGAALRMLRDRLEERI
ncbi:MAG: CinA family protein [Lachnospiraceae bacterium]|nr:CinA family protein [Lachnospiraceae bacterium]